MSSPNPIITRIVIQRNQSLSWRGLGVFLAAGLALDLVFVTMAAIAHWWPVIGFVLASFLALAGVLFALTWNTAREMLTIRAHTVVVEYGRLQAETRVELDRYWARVEHCASPRPALMIRSRAVAVEIGRALGSEDRKTLARRLRGLVGPNAMQPVNEATPWIGSHMETQA